MTKIEWTDETWNPVRGCSRVSEGCRHCYAERLSLRMAGPGQPYEGLVERGPHGPRWTGKVRFDRETLLKPLRWRKPRRVFVDSMGDLFHEACEPEWIDLVFAVMAATPRHVYQVLTKRPVTMCADLNDLRTEHDVAKAMMGNVLRAHLSRRGWPSEWRWPLPGVWLGTSIENQETAEARVPHLLAAPAVVRFLSCEPLLGPIDLEPWLERLDWVIVGGESGPGARPMHPDWARRLRDQCQAAWVPFFMKQMDKKTQIPADLFIREWPESRP